MNQTTKANTTLLAAGLLLVVSINNILAQSISTIQFSPASYTVDEDAGSVTLTVERIGEPGGIATVEYTTYNGTATSSEDYVETSGYLVFDFDSETNLTIVIPILNNAAAECDETFYVTLFNPDPFNTQLGDLTTAVVTIRDDDAGEVVCIPDYLLYYAIQRALGKFGERLTVQDLLSLTNLDANFQFGEFGSVRSLAGLGLAHNLSRLNLCCIQLTSLTVPAGLTNLTTLDLSYNGLTNLTLPDDLKSLITLDLRGNHLRNLALPAGLTNLTTLDFRDGYVETLVLPEPLAITGLASYVEALRNRGVSVYTYPLAVSLVSARRTVAGAFEFSLMGPPGTYTVLGATNLTVWRELATLTNELGRVVFADMEANQSPHKFYRARSAL